MIPLMAHLNKRPQVYMRKGRQSGSCWCGTTVFGTMRGNRRRYYHVGQVVAEREGRRV